MDQRPIENFNFWIKIDWFYKIKSQKIGKRIYQMIIIFSNKKQNSFTVLVIFIIKSLGVEIWNKGIGVVS